MDYLDEVVAVIVILSAVWRMLRVIGKRLLTGIDERSDKRAKTFVVQLESDLMTKIHEDADNRTRVFRENFEAELMSKINDAAEQRDHRLQQQIMDGLRGAFRQK